MAVLIRNDYLQEKLEQEGLRRGVKTTSGIATDLLIERLTQLEIQRGIAATSTSGEDVAAGEGIGRVGMKGTADRHPAPARSAGDTRTGANATGAQ